MYLKYTQILPDLMFSIGLVDASVKVPKYCDLSIGNW
jgi:hypothetical protein